MNATTLATLALIITTADGTDVIVAVDDTFRSGTVSGNMAMSAALAGLAGEELSPWDLSRPMRDALANIAIDWPTAEEEDDGPVTLRSSGIVRAA